MIKMNTLSAAAVAEFLQANDRAFFPPLSTQTDIAEYAKKNYCRSIDRYE
ncbi:hypothetical protein AGMMS49959_17780 [Planctomycetales bacterium]|nr:hypothetical protein AGMMS49959_17780 [Planctomycetales bacterium]